MSDRTGVNDRGVPRESEVSEDHGLGCEYKGKRVEGIVNNTLRVLVEDTRNKRSTKHQ